MVYCAEINIAKRNNGLGSTATIMLPVLCDD